MTDPVSARSLGPGVRVGGKFKLLRSVGEGGMGMVWVARNTTTDADVAIKVLRPSREAEDGSYAARFRHEAKLGARLAHRNITRVFDLVEEPDGSLVLVMELLHGPTLHEHCARMGALGTREAVAIMVPILSALQHAHDHGVVHRDLKPANIILDVDPDGLVTPKLLDFGIAKGRDSTVETKTGDALGTPSYMSPEQVRAVDLDGKSDLFGVGTVLYEAITGQNPFTGATSSATLANVLELEVDPDPRIDPRVWLEIQRALSKQAYARHASAKELASSLTRALGETEHALAQSLRRDAPAIAIEPSVPDVGSAAMTVPPATPQRRSLALGAMLVGIATLVPLVGVLVFRRSPSAKEPVSATRSASAVVASETPSAAPPTATDRTEAPAIATSVTTRRPKHVPPPTTSSKPAPAPARSLGREPGF